MAERSTGVARASLAASGFASLVLFPLVAFLVFSPFYDSIGVPVSSRAVSLMDWQRLSELLAVSVVLVMLCYSILAPGSRRLRLTPVLQLAGWMIIFLIGALSSFNAALPRFAWIEWSWLGVCLLATVLIPGAIANAHASFSAMVRLWVLAALASYTTLYYVRNSDALFDPTWLAEPTLLGFNNPRVFSDYQTALVCLLPWALRQVSTARFVRALAWTLAGCYVALAFVMGSRSLILGQVAAAAFVYLLLGRDRSRAYLVGQLRLWVIAIAVYALLFVIIPTLAADGVLQQPEYRLRYGGSGRIEIWLAALQMALAHPWLGVGPMHFSAQLNPIAASPHNQVLQVFAEFGVVAGVLFVVLVGHWLTAICRGIRGTYSRMVDDERLFALSLLAALIALLMQSFVSPVFNNPHSQALLVIVGGILGGYQRWPALHPLVTVPRVAVLLASLAALYVFWSTCIPWALQIERRNACYVESTQTPTPFFAPRFWQQGWLFLPCEPGL